MREFFRAVLSSMIMALLRVQEITVTFAQLRYRVYNELPYSFLVPILLDFSLQRSQRDTPSRLAAMFSKALAFLALSAPLLASAAPSELAKRQLDTSSHCGQWDVVTAGQYSLLLDQWGKDGATSGSQCANVASLSGNTISWKTTWTWTGGTGVKSFTNIQLNQGINKQLSAISSMPVRLF